MFICNNCGRTLKNEYEECPGCGGSSFKTKADLGEIIIKEPPEGGYNLTQGINNKSGKSLLTVGICLLITCFPILFGLFNMTIYENDVPQKVLFIPDLYIFTIIFNPFFWGMLIGVIVLITGIIVRKKNKREEKRLKELAKKGLLIKALPYKVIDYYKCVEVKYKNSAGVEIPLYSEKKYDIAEKSKIYKTVDLLIDPEDFANYYIDYEIF